MSLEAIRFKNFMAFEDTGWLQLKHLNLLFGVNSSGKSAIIRAFRLLQQSTLEPSHLTLFNYSEEDGVDVGSFLDIAHGSNKKVYKNNKKKIGISFRFSLDENFAKRLDMSPNETYFDFNLEYGWSHIRK